MSGRGGWALAMLPVALPYLIRLKNLFRVAKAFSYMKKGGKNAAKFLCPNFGEVEPGGVSTSRDL